MFDYLAALDDKNIYQNIGIGEPIYIEIDCQDGEPPPISRMLKVVIFTMASGEKHELAAPWYDIADVPHNSLFSSEPWVKHFNMHVAFDIRLDTVKQILEHCTRLSKLSAFW